MKKKAKQFRFIETAFLLGGGGGWGNIGLFIANSGLLSSVNKIEFGRFKMEGKSAATRREVAEKGTGWSWRHLVNWVRCSLEGGKEILMGWLSLGTPSPSCLAIVSPLHPHAALPTAVAATSQPSTAFCLSWLFPYTQDPCLGTAIRIPSGPCHSGTPHTSQGENYPP